MLNWDGRHDTLWSQAIGVIESPVEFNSSRLFVAQQIFRLGAVAGAYRNAHAGGDYDLVAVHGEGNCQSGLEPFGHPDAVAGVADVFQEHGIFVAADSGQGVIFGGQTQLRARDGVYFAQRGG